MKLPVQGELFKLPAQPILVQSRFDGYYVMQGQVTLARFGFFKEAQDYAKAARGAAHE